MSQQARNNPESEENQRMTRENEKAVLYAQMDVWLACCRCGCMSPPDRLVLGLCAVCREEVSHDHEY